MSGQPSFIVDPTGPYRGGTRRLTCSRDDDGDYKRVEKEIGHDGQNTTCSKRLIELEGRPMERLPEARRCKDRNNEE